MTRVACNGLPFLIDVDSFKAPLYVPHSMYFNTGPFKDGKFLETFQWSPVCVKDHQSQWFLLMHVFAVVLMCVLLFLV